MHIELSEKHTHARVVGAIKKAFSFTDDRKNSRWLIKENDIKKTFESAKGKKEKKLIDIEIRSNHYVKKKKFGFCGKKIWTLDNNNKFISLNCTISDGKHVDSIDIYTIICDDNYCYLNDNYANYEAEILPILEKRINIFLDKLK